MPIKIHGNDYFQVHERVAFFREAYPQAQIHTDILENSEKSIIVRAVITIEGTAVATGHAIEFWGSSQINKNSALENCETSAVGRALFFAGYGGDGPVASAEEVQNAIAKEQSPKRETPYGHTEEGKQLVAIARKMTGRLSELIGKDACFKQVEKIVGAGRKFDALEKMELAEAIDKLQVIIDENEGDGDLFSDELVEQVNHQP